MTAKLEESGNLGPKRCRVLVLDAEPVVRSLMTTILESNGYAVTATDDIKFAIKVCEDEPPNLVVTNVFINGVTGHDAMKLLKKHCPGIPVLMVSGLPDSKTIQDWVREDGFDAFPKPFKPRDLLHKIKEMIADA